jgi:alpha-beta hydrolase superfamily lysophospholipase
VSDIQCPTLVLAASDDEIIPKENTLRLVKKFDPEIVTLQVIPETDHNSISNCTPYWSSVCHFINNSFDTP